ncbi:TauD/TfdA family dioxygenase [Streptosporangium canum]|uniref:TauD/TfdA family dioxygenase n=1 Tax=Streptosporangium canum TaxID=324952 RepID=UPI00367EAABC
MSHHPTASIGTDGPALHEPFTRPWCPASVVIDAHRPVGLLDWIHDNLHTVQMLLADYGAVRLRGTIVTTQTFGQAVAVVADGPLLEYLNRSTPRRRIHGQVFTSTEYRPDQVIHLHSEQSYATTWPAILGFWCTIPASSGGETPLAATAQVLERLPPDLVARFSAHGVRYDRWFRPGLDVTWAETFQTEDPAEVDRVCADAGLTTEWHDDGEVLHTTQLAQATHMPAAAARPVWFNQANLFHPAALPDDVAAVLRELPADRLPRNASFGDGSPIPDSDITTINTTLTDCSWRRPWVTNDVMLVDNVTVAHGRRPYQGTREVRVAMAGKLP